MKLLSLLKNFILSLTKIDEKIELLNEKLNWKYLGEVDGETQIDLSGIWDESEEFLLVVSNSAVANSYDYFYIPKITLSKTGAFQLRNGFAYQLSGADFKMIAVWQNGMKFYCQMYGNINNRYTSTAKMKVYYR